MMRRTVSLGVLGVIVALVEVPAAGQTAGWKIPRTPDGHPDLQGVWVSNTATPLERPPQLKDRPSLTDEEVRELKRRSARLFGSNSDSDFAAGDNFFLALLANPERFRVATATAGAEDMLEREIDNRTSLVTDPPDGRIPLLTAEGKARLDAATAKLTRSDPDDPEDLSNARRCLTFGTPRLGGTYGSGPFSYYQIVQTRDYVVFALEFAHEVRVVPMDGRPHLPASIRQWDGDARGHWDGDTLVVDTTNFSPQATFQGSAAGLHLTERFMRVAADTITYEVTVEDRTTWQRPWSAMLPLRAAKDATFEVACHEGNYSMQGVLAGSRAADKRQQ